MGQGCKSFWVICVCLSIMICGIKIADASKMEDVNVDVYPAAHVATSNAAKEFKEVSGDVVKKGLKQEWGKLITKKGNQYYKYKQGKYAKGKFIKIDNKMHYFNKKGIMEKGWTKKGDEYYYFSLEKGIQRFDRVVDGIKIKKDGTVDKTSYNVSKIETMITAKHIMQDITESTDSKEVKLKKAFDWVMKHPYHQYRKLNKIWENKGWEMIFANDMFKKGDGCCVSESSSLAFLANSIGYTAYVGHDTSHAWCEIGGHVYDTLFAEIRGYDNYYNAPYSRAGFHRVDRRKI